MSDLNRLARDWAQNAIDDGMGYVARETLERFALTVATAATSDLRREVEELRTKLILHETQYSGADAKLTDLTAENDRLRSAREKHENKMNVNYCTVFVAMDEFCKHPLPCPHHPNPSTAALKPAE